MTARVRFKLCGVVEERDAVEAARLGVDALGFDFRPESPRRVEPERVRAIGDRLPPFLTRVGVFSGEPVIRVLETVRAAGLHAVQFEGALPGATEALGPVPWIAVLPYENEFDPADLGRIEATTFLLRAGVRSGARPDWGPLRAASLYGKILVGGVMAEEVEWAIDRGRPYGIDFGVEVEFAPGQMDLDRVEEALRAVRRAEGRLEDGG